MSFYFKNPKNQILIFLVFLLAASWTRLGTALLLPLIIFCVGFTVLADVLFTYLRLRKFIVPHSGFITGLILTLIVDPGADWYQILLMAAAAMGQKVFLRPGGSHIFNPAASGLFAGWLLFGLNPSWWAPSLYSADVLSLPNILIYLPVLLTGFTSALKMRRKFTVLSYLVTYSVSATVFGFFSLFSSLVATILSPGTLFFTLLMLPEPKTSPVGRNKQLFYGAMVAGVTVLLVVLQGRLDFSFFDASLTALLLGNVLFFRKKV